MSNKSELKRIAKDTKEEITAYRERVKAIRNNNSYPVDYPCYYCDKHSYEVETGINKCDYCIHNIDNKLLDIIK